MAVSYLHGTDPTPLLGETIGERLGRTVARFPSREALVVRHQGYRASYAELGAEVERAALSLLAMGVASGERVGIWAPNRYEWVILQFATARVGAILVNVNPAYKAQELQYALQHSGVKVLFLARAFRQTDYPALFREARVNCPELRQALVLEEDWPRFLREGERLGAGDLRAREERLQFDDPINIQYTSGTTGYPKGATLSHHNILNNGFFVGRRLGYTEHDRVCIPVPFYHCFGMVLGNLACVAHGACMVIPGESFDALTVLQAVQEEHCTSLYGVPTMFHALLEHPRFAEFNLSSLRTGIMAGAPCAEELLRKVRTALHMPEVTVGYGMTETSPISTQTCLDDTPEKRVASVGRVQSHLEIKVIGGDGAICAVGEAGELCTRGYSVMLGYWNNPQATDEAIDRAGWMHSGDLARVDERGYVYITGRIKDLVIRGGENISPREVEELLLTHPAVREAQVVGVPDEKYGEVAMAWLRGEPVSEEEMLAFCRGRIASFKIPKYWKWVEAFPLTVTGKIQKYRLREMAREALNLR